MKSKCYLALAALTLSFAACNNEEDLQVQESSNQISPIKFTLETGEGVDSRNYWSGRTVQWDENTLLSLFHTGGNAIYKTEKGSSNNKLVFTTQSMVSAGQAVMVHPADTTFQFNGTNSLTVQIPEYLPKTDTNENDSILQRVPFISEGIMIAAYNKDKNQGAGYGKEYNIKLRQVASQLNLRFNWTGYDVIQQLLAENKISQGITIDQVNLNRPTEKFNKVLDIKLNTESSKVGSEAWSNVAGTSIDTWNAATEMDIENPKEQVAALSSSIYKEKDAEGAEIHEVNFMLLPQNYKANNPEEIAETGRIDYSAANGDATIVVETRYGTLTITDEDGDVFPGNETFERDPFTVSEGLNFIVWNTAQKVDAQEYPNSTFINEVMGKNISLYVMANLEKLDMSTVHIEDDQHLSDVIAVHEALQPEKEVVFTLDGDADCVFEMSTANVAKLAANTEIKLSVCRNTEHNICNKIRLTGAGEVPAFDFLTGTGSAHILLANEATSWTWTDGIRKMMPLIATLTNEGRLNVQDGANLDVETVGSIWAGFVNNGVMNILGKATQSENMVNNGEIYIAEGAEYYNNAEFTNEATSLNHFGKIYNKGVFGNINSGVINNYGYIKQMTASSKTFITSNQTENVSFSTPFGTTNKYGTIELYSKDDVNYSVRNVQNEGFIMITATAATVTAEEIGTEANYVKVAGDCTSIACDLVASGRVKFVEIASGKEVTWKTSGSAIRGLIVKDGEKLYIPKSNSVSCSQGTYLKGTIYKGGEFTPGSYSTYFGEGISGNVVKWE